MWDKRFTTAILTCDVTDQGHLDALVAQVDKLGPWTESETSTPSTSSRSIGSCVGGHLPPQEVALEAGVRCLGAQVHATVAAGSTIVHRIRAVVQWSGGRRPDAAEDRTCAC